ncbi:MAG: type IV pilin protein [Pseudomonadota bacterium]
MISLPTRRGTVGAALNPSRMAGLTLVELLLVVVIVAILASIAVPGFQDQMMKTRRTDGKSMLLRTQQALERCYTRFSAYNDANCNVVLPANSNEGFYIVSAVGGINATNYTLQAVPQGAQAADGVCGVLRITSTGLQGSLGTNADANNCW